MDLFIGHVASKSSSSCAYFGQGMEFDLTSLDYCQPVAEQTTAKVILSLRELFVLRIQPSSNQSVHRMKLNITTMFDNLAWNSYFGFRTEVTK
jgi:hypothetical protein